MATNTYVALDKITVSSSVPSVTFTSIPQGYTDLVVVCNFIQSSAYSLEARVGNGSVDTGNNYSNTTLIGKANNTAASTRRSNYSYLTAFEQNGASSGVWTMHLMNYTNTNVYKTILFRNGNAGSDVEASVQLWRSTSAINTLQIFAGQGAINFTSGATFSLYGIAASGVTPVAKATGGAIYADDTYYYHVFGSTGTFTPLSSLTADVLVVAGGGGGSSGAGGAGGVVYNAAQSLSATGYSITVGAGGAGGACDSTNGSAGADSVFNSFTAYKGGGGARVQQSATAGTYGSGGGGGQNGAGTTTGASGTAGQGFAGTGNAGFTGNPYPGGSGGGAGANGNPPTGNSTLGTGGVGLDTWSSWGLATGVGQNVSGTYYIAGGGGAAFNNSTPGSAGGYGGGGAGGGLSTNGTNGIVASGGGGGGSGQGATGGNGGSGVVIVRYLKA